MPAKKTAAKEAATEVKVTPVKAEKAVTEEKAAPAKAEEKAAPAKAEKSPRMYGSMT